jgi:polyribonucleotide nucleotidyltransferase
MGFKGSQESRVTVQAPFHGTDISFESGWVAKQADGAVVVRQGETVVLVTVCSATPRAEQDFFPLVVEYQERAYAAGKIPGGFFKREGKPAEHEILTCRIIDRPIRPMFEDGYMDETQIICTVLSADGVNSPDVLALCGASAALHISSLPFLGPLGGVRVGRIGGKLVINPARADLEKSDIELIVAATRDSIVMVEGGAKSVPESEVLDALYFGFEEIQKILDLQDQLRSKVGVPKQEVVPKPIDSAIVEQVRRLIEPNISGALSIGAKHERREALSKLKDLARQETLAGKDGDEFKVIEKTVNSALEQLLEHANRIRIVKERRRLDGRGLTDVRFRFVHAGRNSSDRDDHVRYVN